VYSTCGYIYCEATKQVIFLYFDTMDGPGDVAVFWDYGQWSLLIVGNLTNKVVQRIALRQLMLLDMRSWLKYVDWLICMAQSRFSKLTWRYLGTLRPRPPH
jgi:hypothetical protein